MEIVVNGFIKSLSYNGPYPYATKLTDERL